MKKMTIEDRLAAVGAKQIQPPARWHKRFITGGGSFGTERDLLLVAILDTQAGQHLTEVRDSYKLNCVKYGIYAKRFYTLTKKQTDNYLNLRGEKGNEI
jgi:hypothetical protein